MKTPLVLRERLLNIHFQHILQLFGDEFDPLWLDVDVLPAWLEDGSDTELLWNCVLKYFPFTMKGPNLHNRSIPVGGSWMGDVCGALVLVESVSRNVPPVI